ncbi:hypothetical protein Tco_0715788 [Tanacetum coccineum]
MVGNDDLLLYVLLEHDGLKRPGSWRGSTPILVFAAMAERMHEVIEEDWDRKAVDGFKWNHQREAMMSSSFESADNEVLTDVVTWRYFLV